jgi:hypothetical protein
MKLMRPQASSFPSCDAPSARQIMGRRAHLGWSRQLYCGGTGGNWRGPPCVARALLAVGTAFADHNSARMRAETSRRRLHPLANALNATHATAHKLGASDGPSWPQSHYRRRRISLVDAIPLYSESATIVVIWPQGRYKEGTQALALWPPFLPPIHSQTFPANRLHNSQDVSV